MDGMEGTPTWACIIGNDYCCPQCKEGDGISTVDFPTASTARNWKSCGRSFGEIPIDDEDAILEEFLGFSEGTDRIEIWHWFDENYPEGVADALMNGGRHGN